MALQKWFSVLATYWSCLELVKYAITLTSLLETWVELGWERAQTSLLFHVPPQPGNADLALEWRTWVP